MENCECRKKYENLLGTLPKKWKDSIIAFICDNITQPDCDEVKSCETLTVLSDFYYKGSQVCVKYKDENEVEVERCFNLDNSFDNVDPKCVVSKQEWQTMTYVQKWQAIIDRVCNTCQPQNCFDDDAPEGPITMTIQPSCNYEVYEIVGIPGYPRYRFPDPVDVANPVTINIPVGTYTIVLVTNDISTANVSIGINGGSCGDVNDDQKLGTNAYTANIGTCTGDQWTIQFECQ